MSFDFDVFVSYSRRDSPFVEGLVGMLRDAGFLPVSLGPGILRFETAGAAGAAIARGLLYHQDGNAHVG